VFRSARLKLTVAYTLAIGLVMAAFSIALYVAISTAMNSTLEVPEAATPQVEHSILQAQLARARLALLGVNIVGWIGAATVSYAVAGRTLSPIEAAMAQQRQFTAHASHELRTPLTVMKGEIDVTSSRERSPTEYQQALERIDEEVMHLDAVVGDLLMLARLESNHTRLERSPGSLREAVHVVIDPMVSTLEQKDIKLAVAVPPELHANLDWIRIRILLGNLLHNALHHTPRGGEIEIRGEAHGRLLVVDVRNSGQPIDAADLPHLFVPFYRGKGAEVGTGTGLGLALCDWIARRHGGSITARNSSQGVVFEVSLPRAR
jgi:signal transduction histidine kinase